LKDDDKDKNIEKDLKRAIDSEEDDEVFFSACSAF